jgi:archaemetzincin
VKAIHLAPVSTDAAPVPGAALEKLARDLPRVFHVPCQVGRERLDPTPAFDLQRGQYYSTEILRRLQHTAGDGVRVLGVTALDLYVPVLTFVFGEAQLEGRCALVSLHRLREEFYGLPPRPDVMYERLLKEAVHELGHTFGLRHCADWRCVMASSHGVELLDVKEKDFCPACWKVLVTPRPKAQSAKK